MRVVVMKIYCDIHLNMHGTEVDAERELVVHSMGEPYVLAVCQEDGEAITALDLPDLAREHGIKERNLPQLEPSRTAKRKVAAAAETTPTRVRTQPGDATTPAGIPLVACEVCGEMKGEGGGMKLHIAAKHPTKPKRKYVRKAVAA